MILGVMNITENYNFAGHTRGYERYARVDFVQPRSQSWERGLVRSVKGKIVTNRVKASNLAHIFLRPYKTN